MPIAERLERAAHVAAAVEDYNRAVGRPRRRVSFVRVLMAVAALVTALGTWAGFAAFLRPPTAVPAPVSVPVPIPCDTSAIDRRLDELERRLQPVTPASAHPVRR